MRIDAHHHLWTVTRGDYGWLTPDLAPIYRDFRLSDLAPHLSAAGIEGTILVQAAPTEAETMFLLDIAESAELVRGVVGWTDFNAPDGVARIDALAARNLLVGLRPMVQDIPDDDWLLRPALAPLLAAMTRNSLVFDALVLPQHLDVLQDFVGLYPELRLVVDHGAKPPLRSGQLDEWKAGIRAIAESTHAVCKLSGLVTEAGSASPAVLAECVDHLVGSFGPQRLMWGSDWPVCELVCSYEEWYQASEMLLVTLGADERERIYSGTARETYGI